MIAENLRRVKESIEKKCSEVNRNPSEITIIAVSKNFSVNDINTVFDGGIKNFGENKAQELMRKYNELGNKIIWHFIGTLQRNKVRFAVEASEYIHSVDSLLLAMEINKRAEKLNKIQKILLEIKTSDEETKSGLADESEISDLAEYCKEYSNLDLVGLMTMAPFTDDEKKIRGSFRSLRNLRDELNGQGINMKELSMGMTNDFLIAVEEGATMLRIGTAIFGERKYSLEQDEE
ncbi:MAG TPA: YggS family pyridoxal phosphate-dependent enzyme [Ignavibacteriaceae bacterium]|nr:YggS family pyridoxal phosphate-dependent enzyme [Ignavibacteriaceae bacterium]